MEHEDDLSHQHRTFLKQQEQARQREEMRRQMEARIKAEKEREEADKKRRQEEAEEKRYAGYPCLQYEPLTESVGRVIVCGGSESRAWCDGGGLGARCLRSASGRRPRGRRRRTRHAESASRKRVSPIEDHIYIHEVDPAHARIHVCMDAPTLEANYCINIHM
jgi:hypothetical protein